MNAQLNRLEILPTFEDNKIEIFFLSAHTVLIMTFMVRLGVNVSRGISFSSPPFLQSLPVLMNQFAAECKILYTQTLSFELIYSICMIYMK